MHQTTTRAARTIAAALALTAVAAAPAMATSVRYEGDTLIYTGSASNEIVYLSEAYERPGRIVVTDNTEIDGPADRCTPVSDGLECDAPARVRLELGGGSDRGAFLNAFPAGIAVEMHGGDGDDTLDGYVDEGRPELLDGGAGDDLVRGFGGDDVVLGGDGADELSGGAGDDELRGGEGDDDLTGDDGAAPGRDVIDGGPGYDRVDDWVELDVSRWVPAHVSLDGKANDGRAGEGDRVDGVEEIEAHVSGRFLLSNGPEKVHVWANMDGGRSVIKGRGGDDQLFGQDEIERIDGGPGDDEIQAGFNHDVIIGGPGRDVIHADRPVTCTTFSDSCPLPYGNDVVKARDGEADQIECGPGKDKAIVDQHDAVSATCEKVVRRRVR